MVRFFVKHKFWVIQFFAWGLIGMIFLSQGDNQDHPLDKLFMVLTVFLSGLLATSLHRWFLKKWIGFGSLDLKKVLSTVGLVLLSSIIYAGLFMGFAALSGYLLTAFEIPKAISKEKPNEFLKAIFFVIPIIIILGWTGFYFGVKTFIKYNNDRVERLKLRDKVKKEQLNTLKGHMNVKFMARTLKSIKELMLVDVKKSRLMLTELSELLRYSLTKNAVDTVELNEELEVVRIFIDLTNLDKPFNLFVDPNKDESIIHLEIPPMLLLNFVELCSKELSLGKEPQELMVSLKNGVLLIEVSGELQSKLTKEDSLIQKSVEQRLRLLYGKSGLLKYDSKNGLETWSMELPIQAQNEITLVV